MYTLFLGKPEGKRLLERSTRRREDYIKNDLRLIGWRGMGGIELDQDRDQWWAFVNTVKNIWFS
jgi:hypothetical protein